MCGSHFGTQRAESAVKFPKCQADSFSGSEGGCRDMARLDETMSLTTHFRMKEHDAEHSVVVK
jgi:hypothetical protein